MDEIEKTKKLINDMLSEDYPDRHLLQYLEDRLSKPGNTYRIGNTLASLQCALRCVGLTLCVKEHPDLWKLGQTDGW